MSLTPSSSLWVLALRHMSAHRMPLFPFSAAMRPLSLSLPDNAPLFQFLCLEMQKKKKRETFFKHFLQRCSFPIHSSHASSAYAHKHTRHVHSYIFRWMMSARAAPCSMRKGDEERRERARERDGVCVEIIGWRRGGGGGGGFRGSD